ncbi:hypothetical protein GYMLUDRAFT_59409 [Collybiopsis luxurians FD-317 M1]|uniref:Unplaced genomic scaffold GYMLUscaffold_26, whole genome shotgun sequence n=1 Tax=Collybiopsis luxurians FD-317 M1 TaxID=944289 RepID=A0A0D0BY58_9AGAR|nr:hypothetical protein GYMLUDRAFT_59409 [Collybiopsis luxurians FD-317 M1]
MEEGWEKMPSHLKCKYYFLSQTMALKCYILFRHLNQDQQMLDENFHIGQYLKNSNLDDISLLTDNSIGYFPDQKDAKDHLAKVPKTNEVHSPPVNGESLLISTHRSLLVII